MIMVITCSDIWYIYKLIEEMETEGEHYELLVVPIMLTNVLAACMKLNMFWKWWRIRNECWDD